MSDQPPLAEQVAVCARQLARGDEPDAALSRLYRLTAVRLLRYAETVTRHRDDAEDAVQATMLKVAARPKPLARATQPFAFLMRMLRNEALMIVRRRGRSPFVPLQPGIPEETEVDPRHRLDADEIRWSVRRAVQQLPALQAEVVVLKVWEQMTFAEVAVVLDISADTAASRYRYALQKLARSLKRQAPLAAQQQSIRRAAAAPSPAEPQEPADEPVVRFVPSPCRRRQP